MNRRLILMRHAKSAWNTEAESDHARPLNKRGRRDAPRVAEALDARGWAPDRVVSSTSARTRETWQHMAEVFGHDADDAAWEQSLYHGDLDDLRRLARRWPDEAATILVLGHNPGWEQAVSELIGVPTMMTTANAALLVGAGATWSAALNGVWELEALIRPRELAD